MFPCTSCGLCCQNITGIEELKAFDLGNGICKYFCLDNNKCRIYENRPEVCKVDEMFDTKYHKYFTIEEFYVENAKACNLLQNEYRIDKSFRITLGD